METSFDPYHKWLGIPPMHQPVDHYRLLGIAVFESDGEVIANAADQRMTHVRTFQMGQHTADSQRILNELSAARVCLLDPDKKEEYDAQLKQRQKNTATHMKNPPSSQTKPVQQFTIRRIKRAPSIAKQLRRQKHQRQIVLIMVLLVAGLAVLVTWHLWTFSKPQPHEKPDKVLSTGGNPYALPKSGQPKKSAGQGNSATIGQLV